MFVSILLLSLLGTSSAYFFFPPVDNSEVIVENFLDELVETIETKDSSKISDLFTDDFFFHGCKGDYDKKKVVAVLTMIPSGIPFIFKSSKFISGGKIEFIVPADPHQEARFILSGGKLEEGSFLACSKFQGFIGSSLDASDDAQTTVEKFLTRMVNSIESKDLSIISGLFKPDFVYKMCTGAYGKTQMVVLWSKLPAETKFGFTLKSVEDLGASIKFLVSASGLKKDGVVSEYLLNKNDMQIESGRDPICPEMIGRSFSYEPEYSDAVFQKIQETIASHNPVFIGDLFDDNFSLRGCKETYTKAQVVEVILLSQQPFDFGLKSSKWDSKDHIEYTVTITGPMDGTFDAQFVVCPDTHVLKSGKIISCPTGSIVDFPDLMA